MIERTGATQTPNLRRQNQPLRFIAMRPPTVPQFSHIFSCRSFEDAEIGCFEQTGHAKKHRFAVVGFFAHQLQRQSLNDQCEREFIFLVAKRSRDFLEERFVTTVIVDFAADPRGFLLQSKLCCGIKHTAHTFLGQVLQGRLTTPGSRERNICAKRIRQNCGIDANLRHIAIRFCARKKLAVALFDENMKYCLFKCRISRMTMCFPIAIDNVELDAAADWLAAVYTDRGVAKIGSSLAIPGAKLGDVDLVGGGCDKMFAEISCEPTRLQL